MLTLNNISFTLVTHKNTDMVSSHKQQYTYGQSKDKTIIC